MKSRSKQFQSGQPGLLKHLNHDLLTDTQLYDHFLTAKNNCPAVALYQFSEFNCYPLAYDLQSQRTQDQSSKSSGSKSGPSAESIPDPDQDLTAAIKTGAKQMKLASDKGIGLDQAILHSINCCRT